MVHMILTKFDACEEILGGLGGAGAGARIICYLGAPRAKVCLVYAVAAIEVKV